MSRLTPQEVITEECQKIVDLQTRLRKELEGLSTEGIFTNSYTKSLEQQLAELEKRKLELYEFKNDLTM